jgi:hypothetical protein
MHHRGLSIFVVLNDLLVEIGVAAYASHAQLLGKEDSKTYAAMHSALSFLGNQDDASKDRNQLLGEALKVGAANIGVRYHCRHFIAPVYISHDFAGVLPANGTGISYARRWSHRSLRQPNTC